MVGDVCCGLLREGFAVEVLRLDLLAGRGRIGED